MLKTIAAIFVILHGLTHAIMAMVPSPNASDAGFAMFFSGIGSWLLTRLGLSESASKTIAILLSAVATIGFVAAGLALFDVLVPFDWWRALAIASAAVSLLLVLTFWHRYLIVGLLIDAVVLVTLLFTKWSPG
jgi:hypothetical protein